MAAGGYVRRSHPGGERLDGLLYAPFAAWIAPAFGIKATVHPDLPQPEVAQHIHDGGLAMLSVHPWIRWPDRNPPQTGGHLVLATGAGDAGMWVHNPSGLPDHSQENAFIAWDDLGRFYAGRGMLIHPA
jgi:hypothetical protein